MILLFTHTLGARESISIYGYLLKVRTSYRVHTFVQRSDQIYGKKLGYTTHVIIPNNAKRCCFVLVLVQTGYFLLRANSNILCDSALL